MKYQIKNTEDIDTPALVVFRELVEQNIDHAIRLVGDVRRLRPHVKTHKSADATALMMQKGITKFKCATIAEAEMLGMAGARDVLLAYQPVGPKVQRFASLLEAYPGTRFACLLDDASAAKKLADTMEKKELVATVYIDVNIGQDRTGILPEGASPLYLACAQLPGLHPIGLHVYDGHIRDAGMGLRVARTDEAFALVEGIASEITRAGLARPSVVVGGSPTFPIHAGRKGVECSPGTFVYWDHGYAESCPEQPFQPAAVLLTRVVSLPGPTRVCLDLGHKSVASEGELGRRIHFPAHPHLVPISHSEEHLVMEAGPGHGLLVGSLLVGIPYHICPTVALYERALVVEKGKVTGQWPTTARRRSIIH